MSIMISAEELNQLLFSESGTQDLVIFDCRFSLADFSLGRNQYLEGHIPGALHLDMEQHLSGEKSEYGGRHPLPSPESFTQTIQQMGVNEQTHIITYDDNRLAGAARLWWLLHYFGHERVQILDGGFQAWCALNLPISQDVPDPGTGDFQHRCRSQDDSDTLTRDYPWLSNHLEDTNLQLIDSREEPRYQGLEEPIDPVAGHIPGALNYPWQGVTDDRGFALPAQAQQERWQKLNREKEVLVYCGSGVTACVNLLSLKLAGIDTAKLYPGSWSDWCSYPDSPKVSSEPE